MEESDLTQKIGPLPVWAWGAIVVVGGLGIRTILARRKAANAPVSAAAVAGTTDPSAIADTTANPTDSSVNATGNPFANATDTLLQGDPTNPAFPTYTDSSGASSAITDAQWSRQAADYLVGLGDDPTQVENGLSNYLNGTAVTAQQAALINQALTKLGSPPEGVLALKVTPAPVTPPAPAPKPVAKPVAKGPAPVGTIAPVITGHSGATLRQGSKGSAVVIAQNLLNQHGAHLAVDGNFGPATNAAVRAFQAANGIAVDGVIGPVTWSKL